MSKELISDAAVKAIQDSVKTETIEVPGDQFTTRQVFNPPAASTAATLEVRTLASVVDYLTSKLDELVTSDIAIHVVSHDQVQIIGSLFGRHRQRETLVSANYDAPSFSYGQFYSCESFVIALQSMFVDAVDRASVLQVVGNIKEEGVRTVNDDGVTQGVTARAGIVRVEEIVVPSPVLLQPYRTFPEVAQPTSPFVLRMKQGAAGQLPTCALFEADGGKWKLEAVENVARYFRVKLAELQPPLNEIAILA